MAWNKIFDNQVSVKNKDFMWLSCCVRMNDVEISVHVHFQGSGAICMAFTTGCVFQIRCATICGKSGWCRGIRTITIQILGDRHVTVSQQQYQSWETVT